MSVVHTLVELVCGGIVGVGLVLTIVTLTGLFDDPARRADRDHVTRCYRNGGWK